LTKREKALRNNKLALFWNRSAPLSVPTAALVAILFFLSGGALTGPTKVSAQAKHGFGFNVANISGFPTGAATLTGGGAYVPGTTFVHSGGSFECTATVLPEWLPCRPGNPLGHSGPASLHDLQVHRRSDRDFKNSHDE